MMTWLKRLRRWLRRRDDTKALRIQAERENMHRECRRLTEQSQSMTRTAIRRRCPEEDTWVTP
jgi:hypothetical protein